MTLTYLRVVGVLDDDVKRAIEDSVPICPNVTLAEYWKTKIMKHIVVLRMKLNYAVLYVYNKYNL